MVNKPLIRPYFWGGGYVRGGRLTNHELCLNQIFLGGGIWGRMKPCCSPIPFGGNELGVFWGDGYTT